jgi:hypothetical protein
LLKKHKIELLVCTCLLIQVSFPLLTFGQKAYELFATKENGIIKLYWDCRSWAPDQAGFMLMRSPAGKSQWVPVGSGTIAPSVDSTRDFSLQGVSTEMLQDKILPAFRKYLADGMLMSLTAKEMRDLLKQHNGLGAGDRIRMKNDFNLALIMGFGCIDPTALPDLNYDYALYAVSADGNPGQSPLDTFRLGEPTSLLFDIDFIPGKNSLILRWQLPDAEVKSLALTGFVVERLNSEDQKTISVTEHQPAGLLSSDSGMTRFRIVDQGADPEKDLQYTLIPVNVFGQRGNPVVIEYLAERYKTLQLPVIEQIKLFEETDLNISWEVEKSDETLISGFLVELSKEMTGRDIKVISDTLPARSREFIDSGYKSYGEVYYYRIKAIGKYGQVVTSSPEACYYLGLAKPPAVTGLRVMLVKVGGETFANLIWDARNAMDTITQGFSIYSDELIPDSFLQISSMPLVTGNSCTVPITTAGGRAYRYKVAGTSKQGKTGTPSEVSLNVGTLKFPKVIKIQSEPLAGGSILIRWDYPDFSDLIGFRLIINEKEIAGTKEITGKMRSYLLVRPPDSKNGELAISLIAVGSEAISDQGLNHYIYLGETLSEDQDAPVLLKYEYLSDHFPEMIQLCWSPPLSKDREILGYALFSDYTGNGTLYRINTVPVIKETSYIYTNDKSDRSTIKLGIAAVYKGGRVGSISTITIPLKNQEYNINQQR